MLRFIIAIALLILTTTGLRGQVRFTEFEGVEWWAHVGGYAYQYVDFLEVDDSGNVYVAGNFDYELYLDSKQGFDYFRIAYWWGTFEIDTHTFFAKYDKNGQFQWAKWLETIGDSYVGTTAFSWSEDGYLAALIRLNDTVATSTGEVLYPTQGTNENQILLRIEEDGTMAEITRFWADSYSARITTLLTTPDGDFMVTVGHGQTGFTIGDEHIRFDSIVFNAGTFQTSMLLLDSDGHVKKNKLIHSLQGVVTAMKSANCPDGGAVILFGQSSNSGQDAGVCVVSEDTIMSRGYFTMRINQNLALEGYAPPMPFEYQISNIQCDGDGNLILSYSTTKDAVPISKHNAYISKLSVSGDSLWTVQTKGNTVLSTNLAVTKDAVFGIGTYGLRLALGSSVFERTSVGATGYIAKFNLANGSPIWVMTDTFSRHGKTFEHIAVGPNDKIHVSANYDQNYALFEEDTIYIFPFTGFNDVAMVTIKDPIPTDTTTKIPDFSYLFDLYPNPTDRNFSIGLHEDFPEGGYFEIWDVRGKLINRIERPGSDRIIRVSHHEFSPGLYFVVHINKTGKIQQTKKLIIYSL